MRTGPCGVGTQATPARSGFTALPTDDVRRKPVVDAAELPHEKLVEVHVAAARVFDELLENLQVHVGRMVLDLKHPP